MYSFDGLCNMYVYMLRLILQLNVLLKSIKASLPDTNFDSDRSRLNPHNVRGINYGTYHYRC